MSLKRLLNKFLGTKDYLLDYQPEEDESGGETGSSDQGIAPPDIPLSGIIHRENSEMEIELRELIQEGHDEKGKVNKRDRRERMKNKHRKAAEHGMSHSGVKSHPYLSSPLYDGMPPDSNPNPALDPNADDKLDAARNEERLENRLTNRLENRQRLTNTSTPRPSPY